MAVFQQYSHLDGCKDTIKEERETTCNALIPDDLVVVIAESKAQAKATWTKQKMTSIAPERPLSTQWQMTARSTPIKLIGVLFRIEIATSWLDILAPEILFNLLSKTSCMIV
jgi:hypothetical protein